LGTGAVWGDSAGAAAAVDSLPPENSAGAGCSGCALVPDVDSFANVRVLSRTFDGALGWEKPSNGTFKIEQATAAQNRRAIKTCGLEKAE